MIARILGAMALSGLMLAAAPAWAQPMSEAALDEHRGGLMTPTGMEIGFGAAIRTIVDGRLALETQLNWTDQGAQSVQSGGGTWTELPSPTGGATRVMHDLTDNRIASVVINTANDRVIRQETDITLHLPQLAEFQQQIAAERVATMLADAAPR
jgi:hypothetical protein